MVEGPIDEPGNWRTMFFALVVWSTHFGVVYGAALIFPYDPVAGWIALAATLAALGALGWQWWRLGRRPGQARSPFAALCIALAAGGIILDAMPGFMA